LNKKIRTWQRALFALGVSLCLAGAFLMVDGSIFGDRTIGIAIVTGIVGISLIITSPQNRHLRTPQNQQKKA